MKKRFIIAAVIAAAAGFALHFLFSALPNAVTALFSPVRESVWEHLKLLFWPTLVASFILAPRSEKPQRLWAAFFCALLAMPLFLTGIYYLLLTGFGVSSLPLDIGLYFLTMFLGFALAYFLYNKCRPEKIGGILLLFVLLYAVCLILFSYAAPPLEIFSSRRG